MNKSPYIIDVTREGFQADVLERSMQVPVLVDFWASWCEPCKQLTPILEKLAEEYAGRFILVKVDADKEPAIARACAVRGLPTLKLFTQGQIGGELTGLQPETAIRALIDRYAPPPVETPRRQAERLVAAGQIDAAVELLNEAIAHEPNKDDLKSYLVDVLLAAKRLDQAAQFVEALGGHNALADRLAGKLVLARVAAESPSLAELQAKLAQAPNDPETKYALGCVATIAGDFDLALEMFWDLFRSHRSYNDEAGRKALISALDMLPPGDARVGVYRRKMFALLH